MQDSKRMVVVARGPTPRVFPSLPTAPSDLEWPGQAHERSLELVPVVAEHMKPLVCSLQRHSLNCSLCTQVFQCVCHSWSTGPVVCSGRRSYVSCRARR